MRINNTKKPNQNFQIKKIKPNGMGIGEGDQTSGCQINYILRGKKLFEIGFLY